MSIFKVKTDKPIRLDNFVVAKFPSLSRSFVKKLINEERVKVDGKTIQPGDKVKNGNKVLVDFKLDEINQVKEIELPILYEDKDVLVINKPPGVISHANGFVETEPSVASFVRQHTSKLEGTRAGIVHRLDRLTSGVMICAKNEAALSLLQKQFAKRKVKKTYVAVVEGQLKNPEAIIDMPIARNRKKPSQFKVDSTGKKSVTGYKLIKANNKYSLLEIYPETGRTHQIRVHFAKIGHPVVGDQLYGGLSGDRLYLHAAKLALLLPDGESREFIAELPSEFNAIIN